MRNPVAASVAALALLAPLELHAERRGEGASADSRRASVHPRHRESVRRSRSSAEVGLGELFRRDLRRLASIADGSPVRRRARSRRRRARNLELERSRMQKSMKVFRATQKGPFDGIIAREAERWGLDPFLFKGLLINESRLDPKLTGKRIYARVGGRKRAVGGGARGIAQFTYSGVSAVNEARQRRYYRGERVVAFRRDDVWDPELAIAASAELLASYIERFGRDGGVTAYNTGPYGGRLVARQGFYRARASGKLSRVGSTRLQGHRFLINVLRKTNALRADAGLPPAPRPGRVGERRTRRPAKRPPQRKRRTPGA